MSFTPSEPSKKSSTVNTEKQKKARSRAQKIAMYIIIGIVCDTLLIAAGNASVQKSPLILIVLYSLIPTTLLSVAFAVMQTFDEQTDSLGQTFEEYTQETQIQYRSNVENRKELSVLMNQFKDLVDNAGQTLDFYATHRALLKGTEYNQKHLISAYLKHAMNGPIYIQPINNIEFFKLHELGIRQCSTWQAIHQAPISKLGNFQYLHDLQTLKADQGPYIKQRIVILKENEVTELYNEEIITEFLRKTAGTDSYWISETDFFLHFGAPKMKSAGGALYDEKLLLLRQDDIELGMLSLDYSKDQIHHGFFKAFEDLNWSLEHKVPSDYFKKIGPVPASSTSYAHE